MEPNKNSIIDIKHRIPVKQNINVLRPWKVSIEGNIGSGKTTEPINWWQNLEGHNLLDLLYKDINKWYNVFQKYVQLTRVKIQTMPAKYSETSTQIFERSIQNNRHTFVEHAFTAGFLKPPEYEVFTQWYDWIIENSDVEIDFIVYLRTSPEIVYERMKSRGRFEETKVPFEYIKELHDFHEKWLITDRKIDKNKLIIIDANQSLDSVFKQCEQNKDKVISKNLVRKSDEHKLF